MPKRKVKMNQADYNFPCRTAEEALGNLLAVIHGDGGHRQSEVGTEKATREAASRYAEARQLIYEAKGRLNMIYSSPDADLLEVIGRLLSANAAYYRDEDRSPKLRTALSRLVAAVTDYRKAHDAKGDGSPEAGRAWMLMSRALLEAKERL